MSLKNILKISLLTLASALVFLPAQGAPKADEKAKSAPVKLKIFKWTISNSIVLQDAIGNSQRSTTRKVMSNLYIRKKNGDWQRINIPSGGVSSQFECEGGANVTFYVRQEAKSKDEEDSFRPIGTMFLPSGANSLFVLMIQRGDSARFFPMNVSPELLPKNKIAVLNMTSQAIGLAVGKHNSTLNAGGYSIFTPNEKEEESSEFKIFKYNNNRWRPVYEGNVTAVDGKRCMLLVYDPYGRRNMPKFSVQQVYF